MLQALLCVYAKCSSRCGPPARARDFEILICISTSRRRQSCTLNEHRRSCAKRRWERKGDAARDGCNRIRRENASRNEVCRRGIRYSCVRTSAHTPIFHPISGQDSDVADGGKEGGRSTAKGEAGKQIGFARYCSFESEYRGDSFSSLFPFAAFSSSSPQLFLSFFISEREGIPFSLSLLHSFPRALPGTYAVCKSRRECVSVRITNRKRFSYLPFIKRNEHVRIDIRPISVYLGALPLPPRYASSTGGARLLHARGSRDSITREK